MNEWWGPSRPRRVEGGLRARSRRGDIPQTWWSARFVEGLEAAGVGGRLARGRTYARAGQVLTLAVDAGAATAAVQGSRPRPYKVRVGIPAYGKAEWARVEQRLAGDAWYTAKLLSGEMPPDIEDVFAAVGLALFPGTVADLSLDCSCPDQAVPCKHLAAVLYLLAESFDADPFAILTLRGREREELLENLRARRSGVPAADGGELSGAPPLDACLGAFFVAPRPSSRPAPAPVRPALDQLPALDVSVRGIGLVELLRPAYRALTEDEPRSTDTAS